MFVKYLYDQINDVCTKNSLFKFEENWFLFLYTEQRIDLRMSFYVKHNRCELVADHRKKGPLSMVFLPFISILIYSSAYKLR